jgi:hypothetical protein
LWLPEALARLSELLADSEDRNLRGQMEVRVYFMMPTD